MFNSNIDTGHSECRSYYCKHHSLFYKWSNWSVVLLGSINQRPPRSPTMAPPLHSADCLRHGNSSDARAVRAVCLLMGGAAASSALGYLNSCPPASLNMAVRAPETTHSTAFSEMGGGTSYHTCSQAIESPHFNSFDFEGDSDFDAFDCGGFAF